MEIIYDAVIEYNSEDIEKVLSDKHKYYHTFSIPKKRGGTRRISEPLSDLKDIQKILYSEIFYPKRYLVHKCAYAYMPYTNMLECIEKHVCKDVVVKMDIKNFFGSITDKILLDTFCRAFRMDEKTAGTVADLCTLDGLLPQGTPTSPILSNFACRILDKRLHSFCSKRGIEYSRYADDLIFSGNFDVKALIRYVSWSLDDYYGFKLNYDKLRVMRKHQRQVILGVVVNERCRLTKEKRRMLRQMLYYAKKYGVEDSLACTDYDIDKLLGYVNYAAYISNEPFVNELHTLLLEYRRTK